MEIGNEISQKIRDTIKAKLRELGSYVDDELPDYIMVMLANKRSKEQMTEDLVLFLGTNTSLFTDWLVNIIQKLQDVTSLQLEETTEEKKILAEESVSPQAVKTETVKGKEGKELAAKTSSKCRQRSPHRTDARGHESSKSSEKTNKQKTSSNVVKTVGLSSKGSSRKRKHSSSDDEDSRTSNLQSVVKTKERNRPTLPVSKQASGNLLKKAVAAAHHSVSKTALSSSLKYDPTSPPSPIRSHSYEEKQQQKELLLQQHRELQKHFLQMRQQEEVTEVETEAAMESDREMEEGAPDTQENIQEEVDKSESKHDDGEQKKEDSTQGPEEPVIELHVSETDTLEEGTELVSADTRIVAFADSQAGGEDSEEERRKRKKKRRAVKSKKERPSSPKFIVTLDGANSDMEDKYDDQVKKEKKKKRSKKKAEVDDFEEIDTSDVREKVEAEEAEAEITTPEKPSIQQITFDLDVEGDGEDTSPVKSKQADKCKFWPDCKNGDSCPFYHPTVTCRSFPNCRFGESCRFIHPPCKFNGWCANSTCPYTHKHKNKQQTSPVPAPESAGFMFPLPSPVIPPSPSVPPIPCKFYPSCTKADCPFYHPQPKPCRFGLSCTRPNCPFTHPAKPSTLKWVSPTLHISERRFALSEQKVTSMPVL